MSAAFDAGFDLYKSEPDLLLPAVAWRTPSTMDSLDFLEGYKTARRQHEEFERDNARKEP